MSHGRKPISEIVAPRSPLHKGPYGRLFSDLPPYSPGNVGDVDAFFAKVAKEEMTELPGASPTEIAKNPEMRETLDKEFGSDIPAGYTYFGQFVDHDITFDPASSLMRQNDPAGLLNHRTPRLDLDSVYGKGPDDSPYMYDNADREKFLIGAVAGTKLRDLPRNAQGRALIGDPRNDENAVVSQIQLAFLLAHNTLVDRARAKNDPHPFCSAQRTLRRLYQHVVWFDFLRRITDKQIHECALKLEKLCGGRSQWACGLRDVYSWKKAPYMPIEFSVAAYRFGHSMVRNSYQTNQPHRGFGNFAPIFDIGAATPDDLRGFEPLRKENYIQWDWFLPMTTSRGPFPQMANKIDTKLANALAALPENKQNPDSLDNLLAYRNLKRGYTFDLPAGTEVAKRLALTPIKPRHDALWFYVLQEAEEAGGGRLGAIGSTIILSVFAGLLKGDEHSYFNQLPLWTPADEALLDASDNQDPGEWTLASIIRLAGLPVDDADVSAQS